MSHLSYPIKNMEFERLESNLPPPGPTERPQESRCTLGMTEQITFRAKMESHYPDALNPCVDPDGAPSWTRARLQLKLKPEEIGQFCVTARKPPPPFIPRHSLSKHAARDQTPPHTRRNTQPLHKRSNLIFIRMTSERTNQPPAEAFSPTALGTKVKLCRQRGAHQLADIKRSYRLVQTASPPAGNSNVLMWLLRPASL